MAGFALWICTPYCFAKKTEGKEVVVWILSALLPMAGVVMFFILIVSPNGTDSQVIHIPNKKQFVTSEFSSLFMQGNPVHKITVGYPIIGQALIWQTNAYTKEGLGDSKSVLSNYRLPEEIDLKNYHEVGLFILPDENYLLDCNNDTIYEIQKQP